MSRRLIDGGIGMLAGLVAGAAGVAIRFGRDSASDTAASSSSSSTSSDLGVTTASSSNSTDLAAAAARFAPYGLPSHENLSLHEGYASSINYRLRIPNWVAEHLVAASAAAASDAVGVTRERSNFHEDVSVPAPWRSTNADYARSGWSRGHLAPAGAHKGSQHELDETFLLSANIVPQDMSSNGSDWLRLERFTRALLERHDDVYIISGPLFVPSPAADGTVAESAAAPQLPRPSPAATSSSSSSSSSKAPAVVRGRVSYEVIGPHEVAVPTHLFKVVLTDGGTDGRRRRSALHACAHHGAFPPSGTDGRRLSAFVVPNAHVPGHPDLDSFVVPVEEVERRSGLRFFGTLPDRTRIPPLCGPERRCGLGVARLDGLIRSNKSLGTLASATDCEGLELAWRQLAEASAGNGSHSGEASRPSRAHERVHTQRAQALACPLQPRGG